MCPPKVKIPATAPGALLLGRGHGLNGGASVLFYPSQEAAAARREACSSRGFGAELHFLSTGSPPRATQQMGTKTFMFQMIEFSGCHSALGTGPQVRCCPLEEEAPAVPHAQGPPLLAAPEGTFLGNTRRTQR